MSLRRDWIASPNYSSRGGTTVTTVVIHTAEGALTYQSLGNYFASSSSGVSSHVGIDDTPGVIGEYVHRDGKAWTASNANPWCVQAELCAFASWTPDDWSNHPTMLANTAAWIAEEAAFFGIPIVGLSAADAQNPAVRGVCQHNDLGAMGGGHWDCGPGFPIGQILDMAKGGTTPKPAEDDDMKGPTATDSVDGILLFWTDKTGNLMTVRAGDRPDKIWTLGQPPVGPLTSGPDAVTTADGVVQVTAAGSDGQVWMIGRDPSGQWQSWWAVGGTVG